MHVGFDLEKEQIIPLNVFVVWYWIVRTWEQTFARISLLCKMEYQCSSLSPERECPWISRSFRIKKKSLVSLSSLFLNHCLILCSFWKMRILRLTWLLCFWTPNQPWKLLWNLLRKGPHKCMHRRYIIHWPCIQVWGVLVFLPFNLRRKSTIYPLCTDQKYSFQWNLSRRNVIFITLQKRIKSNFLRWPLDINTLDPHKFCL